MKPHHLVDIIHKIVLPDVIIKYNSIGSVFKVNYQLRIGQIARIIVLLLQLCLLNFTILQEVELI